LKAWEVLYYFFEGVVILEAFDAMGVQVDLARQDLFDVFASGVDNFLILFILFAVLIQHRSGCDFGQRVEERQSPLEQTLLLVENGPVLVANLGHSRRTLL